MGTERQRLNRSAAAGPVPPTSQLVAPEHDIVERTTQFVMRNRVAAADPALTRHRNDVMLIRLHSAFTKLIVLLFKTIVSCNNINSFNRKVHVLQWVKISVRFSSRSRSVRPFLSLT
jgi:hypothetical protein